MNPSPERAPLVRGRGAVIVTARAAEVVSLRVLLDSVDPAVARAWVVLQNVAPGSTDWLADHPSVARVITTGLVPLSHARNLALHEIFAAATAPNDAWDPTFVGFPDADGRYAPGALATVHAALGDGVDIVIGRYGPAADQFDPVRFPATPGPIDWSIVRQRATSVTLFVSGRAALDLGYVMPYLGLGTPWPAGEDVEFALRALRRGYTGRYEPKAVTYHPYGTELDPARRPVRYLLAAAYPPPGGSTVVRSVRRLLSGPSVPASDDRPTTSPGATAPKSNGSTGLGASAEVRAALKGVQPSVVRRLRHFASATPSEQWTLVQRDGITGSPTDAHESGGA